MKDFVLTQSSGSARDVQRMTLAQDLLESLRPGLAMHGSYEEAAAAVEAIEAREAASARGRGGLASIEESGSEEDASSTGGSDDEGDLGFGT